MHEAWEPDAISTTRTVVRPERTFDSSLIGGVPSKRSLCANAHKRPNRVSSAPDANLPNSSNLSTREPAFVKSTARWSIAQSTSPALDQLMPTGDTEETNDSQTQVGTVSQ